MILHSGACRQCVIPPSSPTIDGVTTTADHGLRGVRAGRSPTRADARPLTARSVLLSLLLGNSPPRAPVARLVRTASLFGIAEGTARTALSRMTAAGEVTADDGWYQLGSERLLARQARQFESRHARTAPWDGTSWIQGVVVADGRRPATERARLRDELARARFGELREGVWLRPDNLPDRSTHDHGLTWFLARPLDDPRTLAARLWDLGNWADRADALRHRMSDLTAPLARGDHQALAEGFVTSAAVLRHLQADPLLPNELLPPDWPGARLRAEYDAYDDAYRACLAAYFRGDGPETD